jgi:hypothetical protein
MTRMPLVACMLLSGAGLEGQSRPNFTGMWKLDAGESQMVGAGGRVGPGPQARQISWIVAHRDPRISVTVNVRDSSEAREFSFTCMTDGTECLNELPELREVRRIKAVWVGDTLRMEVKAQTPFGNFEAVDRLHLQPGKDVLIFDRVVTNPAGERVVKQVFRKQQPMSPQSAPPLLPSVALPSELDRVVRDYERHWRAGNAQALSELFTIDGFIARRGGWIRGRSAIRDAYTGVGSDLRLRAVAFAMDDIVGYIIGAYGYGDAAATHDSGRFILTLRRSLGQPWLIAADLDGANR